MRRILAACLALLLAATFAAPVLADGEDNVVYAQETVLENGLTVVDQVIDITAARASDKTYARTRMFKDGETVVAVITMTATFRYNGTTVSVVNKSVTQTDTYDGWEYVQNSFTSSGGTVTLNAKLTKWFIFNTSFTMTLTCDKDGNISYT